MLSYHHYYLKILYNTLICFVQRETIGGRIIGRIKVNDIRTSRGEQQRHGEQILFDTTVFII